MRSATRSADIPGPGKRFGQNVIMRQRILPLCARAGVTMAGAATGGAVIAPVTPSTAAGISLRRVILVIAGSFRVRTTNNYVL